MVAAENLDLPIRDQPSMLKWGMRGLWHTQQRNRDQYVQVSTASHKRRRNTIPFQTPTIPVRTNSP